MKITHIVALAAVLGLSSARVAVAAGLDEAALTPAAAETMTFTVPTVWTPQTTKTATAQARPVLLPALYATLGVMQAWDAHSTSVALKAGAHEANPTAAPFAGNAGSMLGLKAATTVSTIFFAEKMWKKNRTGAVVLMAVINGTTAAIAMHNMRNARLAAGR